MSFLFAFPCSTLGGAILLEALKILLKILDKTIDKLQGDVIT